MAKMRSPNYPAVGLGQAIEGVRAIWAKDQRTPVAPDVAAKHLGYGGLNGVARMKLSALKKFGLLEEGSLGWRVSDLGMRIIHGQPDSEGYLKAIREAAMRSDLFRRMAATHAKASDDALRSYLLVNEHFSEAGARQFIEAFRNTLATARITDGTDLGKEAAEAAADEDVIALPPLIEQAVAIEPTTPVAPMSQGAIPARGRLSLEVPFRGAGGQTKLFVQIQVVGDSLRAEHVARVRKYLALAEEDLAADVGDEGHGSGLI